MGDIGERKANVTVTNDGPWVIKGQSTDGKWVAFYSQTFGSLPCFHREQVWATPYRYREALEIAHRLVNTPKALEAMNIDPEAIRIARL